MPRHDIIVIGASAGGVEALKILVSALPADLPAALFVVLHLSAHSPTLLPAILDRVGPFHAVLAGSEEAIEYGHIYLAQPDHHLLTERGRVRSLRGPKENRHRPAIDVLFRSAARAYGPRVVGIVLSGALDDGSAGLLAIKQRGGVAIVQDPEEALYPDMPLNALKQVNIDYTLPVSDIATLLAKLVSEEAKAEGDFPVPEAMEKEVKIVELGAAEHHGEEGLGTPSAFSCPECGGVLWELHDGELVRFRCRVGHAFSVDSVMAEHSDTLEEALWVALKTLRESASLSRHLANQARERKQVWLEKRFRNKLQEVEQRAAVIEQVLSKGEIIDAIGLPLRAMHEEEVKER